MTRCHGLHAPGSCEGCGGQPYKLETQRQRAEFAAGVRNRDKGHPVFLSDEAVTDLAAIVDTDARRHRALRKKLRAALEATDLGAVRRLIDGALEELED